MSGYLVFREKFREAKARDLQALQGSMAAWIDEWIVPSGNQGKWYLEHNSEEDIASYLVNWNKRRNLHYFDAAPELVAQSHAVTNRVFTELSRTQSELPDYSEPMIVDYYNAEDYVFQNPYPDTDRTTVTRVLDFGAGFGRQLNMWSQNVPELVFCGVDAIEGGYMTQNFYYKNSGTLPVYEYIDDPGNFNISDAPGIYHIPSWRFDLVPDNFFDLIIGVFVLDEIGRNTALYSLDQFTRCLKPGGKIYARDHNCGTAGGNGLNMDLEIENRGFVLEFRPHIMDRAEIWGLPRIYRKIDHSWPDIKERDKRYAEMLKQEDLADSEP